MKPIIGIVGGVGPHAGYDLALKILQETIAGSDQDHIPVIAISESDTIGDRTSFLIGETETNPGHALSDVLRKLTAAGATVAGIPCNTAHAPRILSVATSATPDLPVVNMIDEVGKAILAAMPPQTRIGLLSTLGTARSGVYQETLGPAGIDIVLPSPEIQEQVHAAVYDPVYGIKNQSQPVSDTATQILSDALEHFREEGIDAVILGCTELPLALPVGEWNGIRLIDATRVLARALIRETYPEKLRPLELP